MKEETTLTETTVTETTVVSIEKQIEQLQANQKTLVESLNSALAFMQKVDQGAGARLHELEQRTGIAVERAVAELHAKLNTPAT